MQEKIDALNRAASAYSDHENAYVKSLALSHSLRGGLIADVVSSLVLPNDSRGIDIGCGIGLPACMMKLMRPDLDITGLDLSDEFIQIASDISTSLDLNLQFQQGSALAPPFENSSFDWIFSMDCVNFVPGLGTDALGQIYRLLKPGGRIVLLAWSSQQILPGYPMLEAKLNATAEGIAPFKESMPPDRHFMLTSQVLDKIQFTGIQSRLFSKILSGPLSVEEQLALKDLVAMRWPKDPSGLSAEERAVFDQLDCRISEPHPFFSPHYLGYFLYTLFTARKP